jgi:uncharacterized protein YqfA (UPF0365 family)
LEFDEFKDDIDERGGYLQEMVGSAVSLNDFDEDLAIAVAEEQEVRSKVHKVYANEGLAVPLASLACALLSIECGIGVLSLYLLCTVSRLDMRTTLTQTVNRAEGSGNPGRT